MRSNKHIGSYEGICPICIEVVLRGRGIQIRPFGSVFHKNCFIDKPTHPEILAEQRKAEAIRKKYRRRF